MTELDPILAGRLAFMVEMTTRQWTDEELVTMSLCAQLGDDPRGAIGHDKAVAAKLIQPGAERFSPEIAACLARAVKQRGL